MYLDRDSYGRSAIMDIGAGELEIIRRAFCAFRSGLLHPYSHLNRRYDEINEQVKMMDAMLKQIATQTGHTPQKQHT